MKPWLTVWLLAATTLLSACSLFADPGPAVPRSLRGLYPEAEHLTAFGCSGEKDLGRLKGAALAALDERVLAALRREWVRHAQMLDSLGVPATVRPPRPCISPRAIPYRHLFRTDLKTHWRDEFEGSCLLASVSRAQARFIIERDLERLHRQFAATADQVGSPDDGLQPFSQGLARVRAVFRQLLEARVHQQLIGPAPKDRWQDAEATYAGLLMSAANVLRHTALEVRYQTPERSRLPAQRQALRTAVSDLGVTLPDATRDRPRVLFTVSVRKRCAGVAGEACHYHLPARIEDAAGDILAECELTPEVGVERLDGWWEQAAFRARLLGCLALVLPLAPPPEPCP